MSEIAELAAFREETRAWLEANCPPEMREPMREEADACWGGRNFSFKNEAQKRWMDVMAGRGWTVDVRGSTIRISNGPFRTGAPAPTPSQPAASPQPQQPGQPTP